MTLGDIVSKSFFVIEEKAAVVVESWVELLLSETDSLLHSNGKLACKLLVALIRRQIDTVETVHARKLTNNTSIRRVIRASSKLEGRGEETYQV